MNYTSIEQSKKLLELGLSPESADMIHIYSIIRGKENGFLDAVPKESILYAVHTTIEEKEKSIPCWSLGALLDLMPKSIQKYDEGERCYKTYHPNLYQAYYHCCGYAFGPSLKQENHDMLCSFGDDSWLDVIYKQVVWLLENGYIKTK